ncbi:uncharacterized protein LOC126560590 [Anopheles maculipalpis]|uniref:uncharacterized protein LOC126560590 n=1 Tax=Anopheles maculipalpis TaxID=1496333 RepID=UPI0021598063|nr:uncharacterized protein LOC126560590 [Anopheles maculipalpis]
MDVSTLKSRLQQRLDSLGTIEQMAKLMVAVRKFLSHFVKIFNEVKDNEVDEIYFQTLYLCEISILRCDITERSASVLTSILNSILEAIHSPYMRKKAVIQSLSTLHQIMCNMYHLEVVQAHSMLQEKLPYLSSIFNEMEHFGMMSSIVGILYQYACKYETNEREKIFADIMLYFNDPTNQLAEMLQCKPETFYIQCRQYLNNIPGRQYYALAARSAVFGEKTIVPLNDMPDITFEWNLHPNEISFEGLFVDKKMDHSMQACIDFRDVISLEIIEDFKNPQVLCTYGSKTVEGAAAETFNLWINVIDIEELSVLAKYVFPLLNCVKYVKKNIRPIPEATCDETLINYEKLYDTMDLSSHILLKESNASKPNLDNSEQELQNKSATQQKRDSVAREEEEEEEEADDDDKENRHESFTANFQQFDTKWKTNLLQHTSKSKKTDSSLTYDPYNIQLMREEEMAQRKEKRQMAAGLKWCDKDTTSGNQPRNGVKRPKYMQCSTPTRPRRATLSKVLLNRELSPIDGVSTEEFNDDEKKDVTYTPYTMLSKAGRSKKKGGSKRQSKPSPRTLQPPKKSNTKMVPTKTSALGSRNGTAACNKKTQISDISSSTPQVEKATLMQALAPMNNAPTCTTIAPYSMLSEGQPQDEGNKKGSEVLPPIAATCAIRKNSQHTTTTHTTKTTKTTTTKRTEVGLAKCAVSGPAEATNTMAPSELLPYRATEQVHCRALYTVEQRQEYRVHHMVDEAESFAHALTEGDRRQALAYARKIVDILTHGINNASTN